MPHHPGERWRFIENFNLKDNYFSFSIIAQKRGPKGVVGNQPVQRLGPQPGVGGGGALRYGLAIMCRTTLGSGGGGMGSKAEIGGQ